MACLSGASFGLVPEYASLAWTVTYNGLSASIRVGEAIKRIEASLPYDKYPVFWIDNFSSRYTSEYRAIPPGTEIILITEKRDIFAQAQSAMAEKGLTVRLNGQQLVSRDKVSYWLTFTEIVDRANAALPGQ